MKRKYFPNNWQAIKDSPDQYFMSISYDELEDWKVYGYELPSSVFSIVRTTNKDTGKVKEYSYQTERGTKQRIRLGMKANVEMYVCTNAGMYFLKPDELPFKAQNDEPENIL